ncbi:STAS domain-containing protein [Actinoplanes sp. NPDC049265]|uniref:STAS domain-containing protein n=1 Tax=Actinoplanes sp. NPDC049265 TaxID=3363902 RepID=UPI0037100251
MPPAPLWSARITTAGQSCIAFLKGELDMVAAKALRDLLITELDTQETTTVVADLADVTFLDSAALGALISAYQHADNTGRRFAVRNPTRAVRRILEITGVLEFLSLPEPAQS